MSLAAFKGAIPRGASVVSGVVSAFTDIVAGDLTINTVVMPDVPAVADAPTRTAQLVALINSYFSVTGVWAVLVTSTTFSLNAGVPIVIALGVSATLAACGLTAATTAVTPVLLATRKAVFTDKAGSVFDVVEPNDISVKEARNMGELDVVGTTDTEVSPPAAYTRVG